MLTILFDYINIGQLFFWKDFQFTRIEPITINNRVCNAQLIGMETYEYFYADDIVCINNYTEINSLFEACSQ